jgi:hypothetical protein
MLLTVSSWQDTYLDTCDTGFWGWLFVPRGSQKSYQEASSDSSDMGKSAIRYWRLAIGGGRFYLWLSQGVGLSCYLETTDGVQTRAGSHSTEVYSRARLLQYGILQQGQNSHTPLNDYSGSGVPPRRR